MLRRNSIHAILMDLRESGNTSDFPYILGNTLNKRLVKAYKQPASNWKMIATIGELPDFKTADRPMISEAEDLHEVFEDGVVHDSKFSEARYQMNLREWARKFSIGRRALLNDDLGVFGTRIDAMGRASKNKIGRYVWQTLIEANANCYDGMALFTSGHGNLMSLSPLTIPNVAAARAKIARMKDLSGNQELGLDADLLFYPPELHDQAMYVCGSEDIAWGDWDNLNGDLPKGTKNPLYGRVKPVEEKMLTNTADSYVACSQEQCPTVEVAFLNGVEEPTLLVNAVQMTKLNGGDDPYEMEFKQITYEVRHDWNAKVADYRGMVKLDAVA